MAVQPPEFEFLKYCEKQFSVVFDHQNFEAQEIPGVPNRTQPRDETLYVRETQGTFAETPKQRNNGRSSPGVGEKRRKGCG